MFTPVETTIGAVLLQQATSNLLYQNGNILGASGLIRQLLSAPTKETLAFFAGMAFSYFPLKVLAPHLITNYPSAPQTWQAVLVTVGTALLAGWGTKMSNGCTSGHMLCGLPRLSGRSLAATATFFPVAMITHHLVHPTLYTDACPGNVPCYTPVYPPAATTTKLVVLAAMSIVSARTVPAFMARATSSHTTDGGKKRAAAARNLARIVTQFFSGLLFALGLHISQMSHPAKVTSFLSFPVWAQWDPSLALIILFAVLPNLFEIQRKGFGRPPSFGDKFTLPTKTFNDVDWKFILGAAAFGICWGLTGTCPGPATLRAFAQPAWGAMWLGGFWLGGHFGAA